MFKLHALIIYMLEDSLHHKAIHKAFVNMIIKVLQPSTIVEDSFSEFYGSKIHSAKSSFDYDKTSSRSIWGIKTGAKWLFSNSRSLLNNHRFVDFSSNHGVFNIELSLPDKWLGVEVSYFRNSACRCSSYNW